MICTNFPKSTQTDNQKLKENITTYLLQIKTNKTKTTKTNVKTNHQTYIKSQSHKTNNQKNPTTHPIKKLS